MASKKKNPYITADLDWCEKKLIEWKNYVDNPENAFSRLEDRMALKQTTNGGVITMIAATKESQMESLRKTMKDILEILPRINELREASGNEKDMRKGFEEDDGVLETA